MTWGGTGGALDKYLDPPGRPESFIMLSQSGRNFLTSDKYMDGAKRRHFREAAQPIALGEVNYGIFQRPAEAPKEGAHIYDKEEVVLPGAVVAPASWRPVPKPALHNPFMMTPATRRLLLKQVRAASEPGGSSTYQGGGRSGQGRGHVCQPRQHQQEPWQGVKRGATGRRLKLAFVRARACPIGGGGGGGRAGARCRGGSGVQPPDRTGGGEAGAPDAARLPERSGGHRRTRGGQQGVRGQGGQD
jgi:hypothetical protein